MKKTLIVSLFLYFLGFSHFVFAIEGDCSYHGGIDCFAGADIFDGSVICNDGWRDSKDSFLDASMCSQEDRWNDYFKKSFEICDWTKIPADDFYELMNVDTEKNDENTKLDQINDLKEELRTLEIGDTEKLNQLKQKLEKIQTEESKTTTDESKSTFEIVADIAIYCETHNLWKNKEQDKKTSIQSPFFDVAEDCKNHEAIFSLYKQGVISGYDDGNFKPNSTLNRAELLKILVGAKEIIIPVGKYHDCFIDVKNEWFAPYVCYAKDQGWIQGYEDGTFKPAQIVNKVESLKMLLEIYDVETQDTNQNYTSYSDVDIKAWYWKYVSKAYELGIIEYSGDLLSPNSGMQRGSFCESLYRLTK